MSAAGTGDAKRALMLGGAAAAEIDALGIDFSGIQVLERAADTLFHDRPESPRRRRSRDACSWSADRFRAGGGRRIGSVRLRIGTPRAGALPVVASMSCLSGLVGEAAMVAEVLRRALGDRCLGHLVELHELARLYVPVIAVIDIDLQDAKRGIVRDRRETTHRPSSTTVPSPSQDRASPAPRREAIRRDRRPCPLRSGGLPGHA